MITYLFSAGVVAVATYILIEQWKSRVFTAQSWDDLIAKLQKTDTNEIMAIALEYLNPGQLAVRTDPMARLASVGGIEGLQRMRENGKVLIALAAQVERWNPEATRTLVAQMRREGAGLRRTTFWICLHVPSKRREIAYAYVQGAAASYYRMISHLFYVVRECSPNELASLNKALWN